jgi:type I restriction enzyme S subunit
LLERLEAVEISLSQCKKIIDFRIDANTYKKDYLLTEKLLTEIECNNVENLSLSVQNFGAYSLCSYINFTEEGIPFLMTENIRHNYIDWNIRKYVDIESHKMLYKSHCTKGQVLVTMAGEYLGRAAVYNKDFICSSNQAIAKITLKDNINPYTVSTFLNSKHGQNQINRFRTITGQPNINMSQIKNLMLPTFSEEYDKGIEDIMQTSESLKEASLIMYSQAEEILLNEIGLLNFRTKEEPINVKNFAESFGVSGRLDAEYYQKKYEEYENSIIKNKSGFTYIKNEFEHITTNSKKDKLEYNYIEIGDVNVGDGSCKSNLIEVEALPANAKTLVEKGDILISNVRPYRGAITLIDFQQENLIVSGAFTVLREKSNSKFSNEVLKVLLRTPIYKDWLLKFNVGTSYPVIKDVDVLELPIPFISILNQKIITEKIQESQKLKKQSEKLLEIAKRSVEIAIEENEVKALKYIKQNMI